MSRFGTDSKLAPSFPLAVEDKFQESAWALLDQFAVALQQADQSPRQIQLILDTVRRSLDTDAVFWYPGQSSEKLWAVGQVTLNPDQCRSLVTRLLAENPGVESQLLRSFLGDQESGTSSRPQSVAMVRISRSLNSWLVAVSFEAHRPLKPADLKVMSLARRLLLNHRRSAHLYYKLKDTLLGVIRSLAGAMEMRDPHTRGHSERVAQIAVRLGQRLGWSEALLSDVYLAGLLHDIGKIGIPDRILLKPGPLTDLERAHVEKHPAIGESVLKNLKLLSRVGPGIRHHHEHWDGTGYPDGLAGENIPLMARLLAVADACEALMSDRVFRQALPATRINAIFSAGAGAIWDPRLVHCFLECSQEFYTLYAQGLNETVVLAQEQTLGGGQNSPQFLSEDQSPDPGRAIPSPAVQS